MKKNRKYFFVVCMMVMLLAGCGEKKADKTVNTKDVEVTVYEQLEVKKETLANEDVSSVEKGIEEWATAFLVNNSDEKDKKKLDEALYGSIVNKDQRKALKKKRKEFYENSTVKVTSIKTDVKKSNKAVLGKRDVGVAECVVSAKGKRNSEEFDEQYKIKLVVDYIGDIVSVYEVEDISW